MPRPKSYLFSAKSYQMFKSEGTGTFLQSWKPAISSEDVYQLISKNTVYLPQNDLLFAIRSAFALFKIIIMQDEFRRIQGMRP